MVRVNKSCHLNCNLRTSFYNDVSIIICIYLRYNRAKDVELYDLSKDLGETIDVSNQYPDIVELAVSYIDGAHVHGNDCISNATNSQSHKFEAGTRLR